MTAIVISIVSLFIQAYVVYVAVRLLINTRHRVAWGCISGGQLIILLRRCFELAAYFDLNNFEPNLTYTLISLAVSICMAIGMHLAKQMIDRMMDSNERLSISEAYHRGLMEYGSEAIFIVNPEGRYINVNPLGLQLVGYTFEQLTRLTIQDIIDPDEIKRTPLRWEELRRGELVISRRKFRKADGTAIYVEMHSRKLPDGTYMSSVRDITHHYDAMERLQFQANLLDTVQQAVVAFGLDGRITYCNKYAIEMYRWHGRQILGSFVSDILKTNLDTEMLQQVHACLVEGRRWTGEIQYQDTQGNWAPAMLIQSPLFDADLKRVGSIGISFDLTELQEAEQAAVRAENLLREFIDAAPFGAHHYELKPDGQLIFSGANNAAERILHVDHAPLVGKPIEDVFPSHLESNIPEIYRSVALTGVPWETSQVRYSDGILDGAFEVSAIQTGQNRMVALFKDVTDRVRAEEALRQREIRLQTINDIARGITEQESVESIIERALMSMFQAYPKYRVAFGEVTDSDQLRFKRSLQPSGRGSLIGVSIELGTDQDTLERLRRSEILAISSCDPDDVNQRELAASLGSVGAAALLAVPVILDGKLIGTLGFDCDTPTPWTEYEMKLLLEVAGYLQIAYRDQQMQQVRADMTESLRLSEERFRQALRNSPVIMFHQDRELRYTWNYNPKDEQVNAFILGRTDHEILPSELADRFVAIKRQVMATRIGQRFETNIEFMGRTTYWDCTIEPLLDHSDEVIGVTGISSEITQHKLLERELRISESRFKTLADNLPAYVWITDMQGQVTYFNRQTIDALGGTFEDLKGSQWLTKLHPEDRPAFEQLLTNSLSACLPFECTIRVRRFDGQYRYVINRGIPQFNASGEPIGYVGTCFDITERLESEHHFRDMVSKLRLALQAVQSGTFEYDIAGNRLVWSEEMQQLYGIPVGTFTGSFKEWTDRLLPEELQETLSKLAMDVSRGGGMRNQFRIRRLDTGEIRWLEASGEVQYDKAGNPCRMIGVNTDITERKRAETELRHAEYLSNRMREAFLELNHCETLEETLEPLLRAAFDLSGLKAGGIYLINGDNAELEHHEGLPDEFRGMVGSMPLDTPHVKLVLSSEKPIYMPGDLPALKAVCERCGINHIFSFPLRSGRGEVFGFLNLASFDAAPPSEPNILALEALVSEVGIVFHRLRTERALEEASIRTRILIDQSRDSISIIAHDGRLVEHNQRFAEMLGYTQEETSSLYVWDWDCQLTRERILELINQLGSRGMLFETSHRRKDGSTYAAEVSASAVSFGQDKLIFCVCRDITDRKNSETERAHLESQLRLAQKLETIGTMAAGIAHDFNNLLVPIIGYTELVASEKQSGKFAGEYLQEVLKAAYRAKGLVAHILAFSRQQTGERKPVQIETIITEVVAELSRTLDSSILVRYSAPGQTSPVLIDPGQIQQILMNLCENAVHSMAEGGELTIQSAPFTQSPLTCPNCKRRLHGKMVEIQVRDTGCGMDEGTLKRIFDPFFTTKGVGKGTGLGLAVAHGIVTQHSGHICAESKLGQGTTFHLFLPISQTEQVTHHSPQPDSAERGHESILIIDDEPSVANSHAASLNSLGYRVTVASDPRAGVTLFQDRPETFDCVLLDQRMPELTGDQVAVQLLRIRPDIPIVICSGFSDSLNLKCAQDLGISDVIMKPVIAADLSKALRNAMSRATGSSV